MRTKSLCYIADMSPPCCENRICAALRVDSYGMLQRMAAVNITYGYGKMQLPDNVVGEILDRIPVRRRFALENADIIADISERISDSVSFAAIYACGRHACHVTTGNEVMSIVRNGRMIGAGAGSMEYADYNGNTYCCTVRLKNNDFIILHGQDVIDSDIRGYICELVALNLRRRSERLSYKSNAEILDMLCDAVKLKCDGNIKSTITAVTCVRDI